jgi:hypothetical protein
MRRISPARDIQLDEAERAELLPVMDAAIAAARLTSELRSLQMARRADAGPARLATTRRLPPSTLPRPRSGRVLP